MKENLNDIRLSPHFILGEFLNLKKYPENIPTMQVVANLTYGCNQLLEPAVAGKQLVGVLTDLQELHKLPELRGVSWADVGSLAEKMLRVLNTAHLSIDGLVSKTRINNDGAYLYASRLQNEVAAVGKIRHDLHRRDVLRIFFQIQKLAQLKVL